MFCNVSFSAVRISFVTIGHPIPIRPERKYKKYLEDIDGVNIYKGNLSTEDSSELISTGIRVFQLVQPEYKYSHSKAFCVLLSLNQCTCVPRRTKPCCFVLLCSGICSCAAESNVRKCLAFERTELWQTTHLFGF